jgi:AraC family transcriptional regulator
MARGREMRNVKRGGLAPWQVELTSRQLLGDIGDNHPVSELASLCGLSRSHFAKAFKASMGMPPHRWLLRQRVHRAAEMLERTEESISVIAASCGFADQSHLTRIFHAMVGSSPADWRRRRRAGVAPPLAALPFFSSRRTVDFKPLPRQR